MKELALNIVTEAFKNKVDKAGRPYMLHLHRVSERSKCYFDGDSDLDQLETIALLHDLLEDCPEWTAEHLRCIFRNANIVTAVTCLTKTKGVSYDEYIKKISEHRFARAVKLADLEHNMDLTRLSTLTEKDIERVKKYHKSYTFLLGVNNTKK